MDVFTNRDQNVHSTVNIFIIKKHVFTCYINNTTTSCSSPSAQEKEWTQKQLHVQELCDRRSQFVAIEAQLEHPQVPVSPKSAKDALA